MSSIPAGFEPLPLNIPYLDLVGPFYRRIDTTDDREHLGLLIERRHCNSISVAHGGMLATFADIAAARALARTRGEGGSALTISLNIDFVGSAPLGSWIEAHVEMKKLTGGIGFASCELREGERVVVVASGPFRFITRR